MEEEKGCGEVPGLGDINVCRRAKIDILQKVIVVTRSLCPLL